MILQAILSILHTAFHGLFTSFPTWTFSVATCQPIMAMIRYFSSVSNFVPVTEAILPIFVIQAVIQTFFLSRRILVFIANYLRGAGGT